MSKVVVESNVYFKQFFLIFILFGIKAFSQEILSSDDNLGGRLLTEESNIEFKIIDDTLVINFVGEQVIETYTNNKEFNQPKISQVLKSSLYYINYVGSYGNLTDRVFVYTKNSNKKFLTLRHNVETDARKETKLEFKLKNQAYLGHISFENKFYLISVFKNSRTLRLTQIDLDSNFTEIDIDLENGTYFKDSDLQENMPPAKTKSIASDTLLDFGPGFKTSVIKKNVSNSNADVTKPNKIYLDGDNLVLTLDSNPKATVIINIDLNDFSPTTRYISNKIDFKIKELEVVKSNSFLFDDILYQVKGTKKEVAIVSYNLATGEHKKIIDFNKTSPFFKDRNLLISEELKEKYHIYGRANTKEGTISKRLKKIMKINNDLGLQITKNDSVLLFNLGGYLKRTRSAPLGVPGFGGGGFTGSIGFGFNSTFIRDESLDFFVRIEDNSIALSDFKSPYIRMGEYLEKKYDGKEDRKTKWIKKFNIGTDYILGYLDKKTKEYHFVKFN